MGGNLLQWWNIASAMYDSVFEKGASRHLLNEVVVKMRPSQVCNVREVLNEWYLQAVRRDIERRQLLRDTAPSIVKK